MSQEIINIIVAVATPVVVFFVVGLVKKVKALSFVQGNLTIVIAAVFGYVSELLANALGGTLSPVLSAALGLLAVVVDNIVAEFKKS